MKGDIPEAVKWYKEKKGYLPAKIGLAPKNQHLTSEAPEGIEVLTDVSPGKLPGTLCSWEIWLSGEKKAEEKLPEGKTDPPDPQEVPPDAAKSTPVCVSPVSQGILPPPLLHKSIKHSKKCLKPKNGLIVAKIPVAKIKKPKKVTRHGIRGRPPKFGTVTRTTQWRRAKKLQERLL